jgi:broad specificity phosphatase PhoE
MIITLVRHGEVEERYHRCYNGHNDIALSARGIDEARQLAKILHGKLFDAVYSSDLKRCRETLGQINASSARPVTFTPALREKSWGRHEGMTFDAIAERDGLVYESFLQWINALDGEPYDLYIERIRRFFTDYLPRQDYGNVLVVTHAGVIRVLMHLLQKISLEAAFSVDFPYSAYTTLNTSTWEFGAVQCV